MMRYAQSGHRKRGEELDAARLARVAAPETKRRGAVFVAAAVVPVVLAFGLAQRTRLVPEDSVQRTQQAVQRTQEAVQRTQHAMQAAMQQGVQRTVDGTATALADVRRALPKRAAPPPPPTPTAPTSTSTNDRLRDGEVLSQALARHGVDADDVSALLRELKGALDVRSLRAGARFSVTTTAGRLERLRFHGVAPSGVPRTLLAVRNVNPATTAVRAFDIAIDDAPVVVEVKGLVGSIKGSLYNSMLDAGGDAVLVDKFVDVFAWNIDFYRAPRAGDEWKVLVEQRVAGEGEDRRVLGYGKVLAAEYENAGTVYRGIAFASDDGAFTGYFDDNGDALERTFLKNPMEVTRVTSNYGMRFHPVLGRNKAHEGVDYGAPVGTPVFSVADGVVKEARYSKTAGNMILVQHMNGIHTEYFHLSRFAEGLKEGARIKQKQVIGFVGSTGMSTGPHLHFGMLKGGAHVDPAKQKFPNAKPVPAQYRAQFDAVLAPLLAQLESLS